MNNEINIINKIAIEVKEERKPVLELLENTIYRRAFSSCVRKAVNETGLDASYFDDLFNDAVDVLISECIPKYRADSGEFLTYSLYIIGKRLYRMSRKYKPIKIPDKKRLEYNKAKKLINELKIIQSNLDTNEIKNILTENGIKEDVIGICMYEKIESLDNDESEYSLYESISDEKDKYNDIIIKEISSELKKLMEKTLTKRQRDIVYKYFYQNKPSFTKVAKEFKVSPHAVRKSIKQSIVLLKKKAEKYGIKKEDLIYFSK
jgi:RNA polymerase sigma factor (sigma-70 family)